MMEEPTLQPIAPDELPDLLARLDDGRTADLALIGPNAWLPASPDDWPEEFQGRVVYQLTGLLSGLPRELLRLDRLQTLILWSLDLQEKDAAAIAEHLNQLTSLNLRSNQVGDAGARAIAENLGQLTSLDLEDNEVGDETVTAIGQQLTGLVTLELRGNERVTTVAPLAQLPLARLNIAETGVADLSPLKSLILAGLPVKWDWIPEGPGIYVVDCPLTHPSPEIARQGPEAVRNYFREIEAQGMDRLFEAKLLIVGEGLNQLT